MIFSFASSRVKQIKSDNFWLKWKILITQKVLENSYNLDWNMTSNVGISNGKGLVKMRYVNFYTVSICYFMLLYTNII